MKVTVWGGAELRRPGAASTPLHVPAALKIEKLHSKNLQKGSHE